MVSAATGRDRVRRLRLLSNPGVRAKINLMFKLRFRYRFMIRVWSRLSKVRPLFSVRNRLD